MTQLIDPSIAAQFEKLPPHSVEAEMSLLGSLALEKSAIPLARAIAPRDAFFQVDHQVIFDVLCALSDGGRAVDGVLLAEELKKRHLLEEVGGMVYLMRILNAVPSAAHWEEYAKIVREKWMLRSLIQLSNEALRRAYAPRVDAADTLISDIASRMTTLAVSGSSITAVQLSQAVAEVLEAIREKKVPRILTGLSDFDLATGGLPLGGVTYIGARPRVGKSMVVKNLLFELAKAGTPCGLITLEEDRHKIAANLLSRESHVPNNRIVFRKVSRDEEGFLADAAIHAIGESPFFIVEQARTLPEVIAAANVLAMQQRCRVIAVDHIHLLAETLTGFGDNIERRVTHVSGALKMLWKQLGVAGVGLCQFSGSGRERPRLSNLRGSRSLDADGDLIVLLHRACCDEGDGEDGEGPPEDDGRIEMIVAKNKDSAPCEFAMRFIAAEQRIENLSAALDAAQEANDAGI